jgi:YidC/Oxa1 family membrane protein insertase
MNSVDRNQAIGLVLISAMLIAYFTFFSDNTKPAEGVKTEQTEKKVEKVDLSASVNEVKDTAVLKKQLGTLANFATGTEEEKVLENENIRVILSSKGATVKSVFLKKYKTYAKTDFYIVDSKTNNLSLYTNTDNGPVNLSSLYYIGTLSNNTVSFRLDIGSGQFIEQNYTLKGSGYELDYGLKVVGLENIIRGKELEFKWKSNLPNTEKDLVASRQTANITYRYINGDYNSLSETSADPQEEKLESKTNWVTFKQKFFSVGFISNNGFSTGIVNSKVDPKDSTVVKTLAADLYVPLSDLNSDKGSFKFYFGPNILSLVSDVAPDFKENVYLGWPVINNVNRYTMAPLLTFLEKFIPNYGIIIILMVLIIKLVLFPLSYKSYVSQAKMKVLKPELDENKARVGENDMTAIQQEQMKLYNSVGVNPLSGCIPVLLQMPILLAMFNFFPNAIEFRQQPFLWAEDLSTFDSIASLPFKIPFYGDHVSLFALLMTASTILYTWYNQQMNVSATGPMIAMSYVMPVVFLFVMNSLPAGLGFYYFVSNMVTIGQQYIIKMFVDEKEIRAKLDNNKKTADVRKPNRFQQRLIEAMEQQKELKKKPSTPLAKKK